MNPYQETLLSAHKADLAQETRALQLSGDSGAALESETELFAFATARSFRSRIWRVLIALVRRHPVQRTAPRRTREESSPATAPLARLPVEPAAVPVPIE
jgi:hypothetical protein